MTVSDPPAALEVCPTCGQGTAAHLFRIVDKKSLCLLCAKRTEDSVASLRAHVEDQRVHGGLGWLWKHFAYTAFAAVGYSIVKHLILHFLTK